VAFGDETVLTSTESEYGNFTSSYWSALQGDLNPQCIFKAPHAVAVSSAVLISRLTQCPFAAKSGGHAAFPGASSIEGGITISFEDMNQIEVSADKTIVSVGPGNTWGTLYEHLADYEVAAIGGRVHNIGVGGLTLGGTFLT
jgi:FAD/FMN-containing dehydrogenase